MAAPDLAAVPAPLALEATAVITVEAARAGGDPPPLPRFRMVANTGQPMKLAGWRYPVVMDLAGLAIPSQALPIRLNHDPNQGVGHTDTVGLEGGELVAAGVVSRDTEAAREVVASAGKAFPWQASLGASADEIQYLKEGEQATVNGRQYGGPLNVVRKSTLGEISFVDRGADGNTSVRVAAMGKDGQGQSLLDAPPDGREPIDGAEAAARSIARAKAERKRREGIAALVEEHLGTRGADVEKIEAAQKKAVEEGWTVQETELALLRETRPRAPAPSRTPPAQPKVLEAALCLAAGVKEKFLEGERDYGPDVLQEAWKHRKLGINGTIAAALESAGIHAPHGRQALYDEVLNAQRVNAAGFSQLNLPGILGNVANKVLLEAFTQIDATYERVAEQADFNNFYTHSIFRLGVNGEFEKVAPDGQLKHATLGQDAYSNKLDTYGKMLTLSRQDIYNDDLNAFRSLTAQLARKARLAPERALYALILESVDAFFTAARGNRLVGALGVGALGAAQAAMMSQGDADGDPIYATPEILLVPPGLRYFADVLYTSESVMAFITGQSTPTQNPFRGRFRVESSPFLSTPALPGNSPTTWYMLANPNLLPAFQVAFLDGRRAPTIETADAVFSTLGVSWRAYFDFGVAQLDYRGALKSSAT